MSSSEIDILEIDDESHQLTVEGYEEGYYSSFWPTDIDHNVLLELCERYPPSSDASATIQVPTKQKFQVGFEVVDHYISEDTEFLRIDDHEYAITWQKLNEELNRVGFISYEPNGDMLTDLYQSSAQTELRPSDQESLETFLSKY